MPSGGDIRKGMFLEVDNELYSVTDCQHVKPGKGGAFARAKLKNFKTGNVVEKVFRAEEKVTEVRVEKRDMQYLYSSGDLYYFMNLENYDQVPVSEALVKDISKFLKENITVGALFRDSEIIGIELPYFIEFEVKDTEPGFKGDTVSASFKPATIETGAVVMVPLFINPGDIIKVDTRDGSYIERVKISN